MVERYGVEAKERKTENGWTKVPRGRFSGLLYVDSSLHYD